MKQPSTASPNLRTKKIRFIFTMGNALFWGLGKSIDVYRSPVIGMLFELLWLFALIGGLFVLPILSVLSWKEEKFDLKSLNLYSVLISVITLILTVFFSK